MEWIKQAEDGIYRCSNCETTIYVDKDNELPDYCKFCDAVYEFVEE